MLIFSTEEQECGKIKFPKLGVQAAVIGNDFTEIVCEALTQQN